MKVSFLIHNRYAIGGVIKSTVNLAAALADDHRVEVVSLLRDREDADLPLDPRVGAVDLVDLRTTSHRFDGDDPLTRAPVRVFPVKDGMRTKDNTRLVEVRLAEYLAGTDADVVVSCHPGIAVCLGRMGGDFLKVAQIHQASFSLGGEQRKALREAAKGLDAVVSVSREDAGNLRRMLAPSGTYTTSLPNCLPPLAGRPSDGDTRTVMAVGRLDRGKHYDRLIRAFADVAGEFPAWRLRIYGRGGERTALDKLVGELGLHDRVLLMGATGDMEMEWPKGAIAVSASAAECLPMNVIEAMTHGLPVISTDCDYGPREIIEHGTDGLLVPVGDVAAMAGALRGLMADGATRSRMARAALLAAERYAPGVVADRYGLLFQELAAARSLPATASWTVSDEGDVELTVPAPEHGEGLRLVCVGPGEEAGEVAFPFGPASPPAEGAAAGRPAVTAVVPRDGRSLPEASWDLYVESPATSVRRRLRTGSFDNRALLRPVVPRGTAPVLHALVPTVGQDRKLSIRSWMRDVHAEASRVEPEERGFTVSGRLWGTGLSRSCTVWAKGRENREGDFLLPVLALPGGEFRFTVPARATTKRRSGPHDVWDLFLVPSPGAPPVRISRLLGDYTDKKGVHNYPPLVLGRTKRGPVRVRPFFTADSDLSLNAVDLGRRRTPMRLPRRLGRAAKSTN
ncbi:glycosyltransferase [Streptomyces sp. NPDC050504]|uniref:glycosyltransferase n=1 Tax=Streptomyces sp. NPDC050504 TaxID=3365618 RepID=UPI00378B6B92